VITIVTAVFNARATIEQAVKSVHLQKGCEVKHIIVDGGSTDGTLEVLQRYAHRFEAFISEPDSGIYDALNKGFHMATGDIVGILHADDCFKDEFALSRVREAFQSYSPDYVYGDIDMVDADDRVVRSWRPGVIKNGRIKSSQVPHTAFFITRELIKKIGVPFDSTYRISADLKQQLIIANKIKAEGRYLPVTLVKMRTGGTSTKNFIAYLEGWKESRRAWNEVEGSGGAIFTVKKILSKLPSLTKLKFIFRE